MLILLDFLPRATGDVHLSLRFKDHGSPACKQAKQNNIKPLNHCFNVILGYPADQDTN